MTTSRQKEDNIKGQNPEKIRRHNLGLVFSIIQQHDGIPRNRLAKATRLTKTAVSAIVNELITYGLISEEGEGDASRKGGRKPIFLKIRENAIVSIGVDIRREIISALLMNLHGEILARKSLMVSDRSSKHAVLNIIDECISTVRHQKPEGSLLIGIGVGSQGPIDVQEGIILDSPDFGAFKNVNIKQKLAETYHLPIFIDTGAAAAAAGELFWRTLSGERIGNLVFIEIDLGLGFGMIINDKVIHGETSAGEFGHTVVHVEGEKCLCGRKGCLFQYASGAALIKNSEMITSGLKKEQFVINDQVNYGHLLEQFVDGVTQGNQYYREILDNAARYLGIGIVNIFNLLSPGLLVIGSSIPGLAELYMQPLLHSLSSEATLEKNIVSRMRIAKYGADTIALGAATNVIKAFCTDPRDFLDT